MPRGRRTRYFVHRDGFKDGTAYVRYEGESSYLVIVQRSTRELRSDVQRCKDGIWRELTAQQAADVLRQQRAFGQPESVDAVDPVAGVVEK